MISRTDPLAAFSLGQTLGPRPHLVERHGAVTLGPELLVLAGVGGLGLGHHAADWDRGRSAPQR